MRRNYWLIAIALLPGLFIYLFYRPGKTVINEILITFISFDKFNQWQQAVAHNLQLHDLVVYSLPGGLWVFATTMTSKYYYIQFVNRKISLAGASLFFAIGLEISQLLHLTNGCFDFWDVTFSVFFWGLALAIRGIDITRKNMLKPFTMDSVICLLSFLIVYLSHVTIA